ncbi:Hsp20 family protein [Methylocella silvestris]|uniref:Heat-shock protein Hsp20 n=1 Tax=Methylocella silvestris TaxID=199596 RepID=A0A2J7TK57_METSI|nr:Hsp20 family protein [Methylocella silvestris]PNG27162.1 heat-shock protein Hsp20 [Methylocella silvestris]
MSRGSNSHSPFVLGFGAIERSFPRSVRPNSDGYPPYNIERVPGDGAAPARLRVIIAVAGFTADQLEVVEQQEQIVIRGRQTEERERSHLHRGIATRQFQRVFLLGEAMQVAHASLDRGLLSVELTPRASKPD